jgi:hypothetical protein
MEPIVAGAIALVGSFFGSVGSKIASKAEDKLATFAVNRAPQLLELLKRKQPELAAKLKGATPEQEEELVAEVVAVANTDSEIKAELQNLGQLAQSDAQINQTVEKIGSQYNNSTVNIENQNITF